MDVATDDDDHDVGLTFQLVRAGSSKSKDLLTDSAGHDYTLKPTKNKSTRYWRCVVRNKRTNCCATVIENNDGYHPGKFAHICQTKVGVTVARTVSADVSQFCCPVWALERCRISPSSFVAYSQQATESG